MSALDEWQEHYLEGLDLYIEQYDPESDDREPEEIYMEQVEFAEEYADDMMDDDDWDDDDDDDDGPRSDGQGDSWNPKEEDAEVEDMPGDNAFERAEAYDNWDWDAADE